MVKATFFSLPLIVQRLFFAELDALIYRSVFDPYTSWNLAQASVHVLPLRPGLPDS